MAYPALRIVTRLLGSRGALSVLIYHRVLPRRDRFNPDDVDAGIFDWHMATLAACYNVLPLSEAVDALKADRLPPHAAAVTFDDGYADNFEVALPILKRHKVHATFFIASGFLDGGTMWNDKIIECMRRCETNPLDLRPLGFEIVQLDSEQDRWHAAQGLIRRLKYFEPAPREEAVAAICSLAPLSTASQLMLSSSALRQLAASGMEIGGHTVSHPILASLKGSAAEREIADNRDALEHITGQPVRLFAYPNGKPGQDYRREHVDLVRKLGFKAAVSTAWGAARSGGDLYQLPRFTPWDSRPAKFALRLLHNQTRRNPDQV